MQRINVFDQFRRQVLYAFCLLGVFAVSSVSHAFDIHDVANPPSASMTYVGDVIQNGLPMQMKQFTTDTSITELFAFYKQRWSDNAKRQDNVPDYIEKRAGDWYVLSKMEASKSVVVQARKANSSTIEGFISVTDLAQVKEQNRWSSDFPRMHGTELVSNTESVDKGRIAYTLILYNDYSVNENSEYYRSNMHVDGWQFTRGGEKANTAMLYFQKDNWQCDITVTEAKDGKTVIFTNLVETNENS
jgi:hypothetical protein